MSEIVSAEPVVDAPGGASGEITEASERPLPGEPRVTFKGNAYDLMSLGSLATGALLLFSCLTCNLGYYCFPLLPVVLGLVGLLAARQSVEVKRTRLWSWLGIAAGGIVVLLVVAGIGLYIAFIVLMAIAGGFKD